MVFASTEEGKKKFYTTDRRVIRYVDGWFGEDFEAAPYERVRHLTLRTKSYLKGMLARTLLIFLGLFLDGNLFLFGINLGPSFILGVGAPVFILSLYFTRAWYELEVVSPTGETEIWSLKDIESEEIKDFVQTVRERSGGGGSDVPPDAF